MEDRKAELLTDLYNSELVHHHIYYGLSKSEKSARIKRDMRELAKLESYHAGLWAEMLRLNKMKVPEPGHKAQELGIMLSRRIFGLALTIKLIEHAEEGLHMDFDRYASEHVLSNAEKAVVSRVRKSEGGREATLESKIVEYNPFFNNIRDVMFGMNDGLVELLAVVSGLAAALQTPILIFIAGFIVAISGTLSMAAGAYISTDYQQGIDTKTKKVGRELSAKWSAFYVGVFYFVGALFPLSPFAFGAHGYIGIIIALIATSVVLTVSSTVISVASDKSITRNIAKTLALSLSAAGATILLGAYIRHTFHITV